jgi:tetratricopeptide (TPR) repeat protein
VDEKAFSRRPEQAFAVACRAHQDGRVQEAARLYREFLQGQPQHAQAWYLLGAACQAVGQTDDAVAAVLRAVQYQPRHADANNLLGVLLAQRGQLIEAVGCFCSAMQLRPGWAEADNNLRLACAQLEGQPEGLTALEQLAARRTGDSALQYRLGMARNNRGDLEQAAVHLREAVRLDPGHILAHGNLGAAYVRSNRLDEAAECFRAVLRLQPGSVEAVYNLGVVALKQERWQQAEAFFRQALQGRPGYADAHASLGQVLVRLGRLDEALAHLRQALHLNPQSADAHCSMGYALAVGGRHAEALACFEADVRIKPDHADAHFERSLVWLLLGDWRRGLPEYEWRWKTGRFPEVPRNQPAWDGSDPAGRTLLLHAEQGLGDTLQFIRYAPLVRQRGARVVVACQEPLLPLLGRCAGIDELIGASAEPPPCDARAAFLSLPLLLGNTPQTVPAAVPYLHADPSLVEHWRRELPPGTPFKIGIVWQGNPGHRKDHLRSVPLRYFAPLARLAGVQLYSLQKGHGREHVAEFAERGAVTDLADRLTETAGAFTDTAAALMNLDLLVAADTAVVHLAGGLGRPVLLALSSVPDWRWLLDRPDTPWYPHMRLFRQTERGDWGPVFQRITEAVLGLLQAKSVP